MRRRCFLNLIMHSTATLSLGALSGCAPSRPFRIAVQPWSGYQFLVLAWERGWLPPGEVEIVATEGTAESFEAIRKGEVDAAALTLDEVLRLRDEVTDVQVVLVFNVSVGADVVLAKPDIGTLGDLAGRRIGVEDSTLGAIMISRVLKQAGLTRDAVTIIPMSPDHVAAYHSENMDALITYEPSLSVLRQQPLVTLFDSRQLPLLVVDVLAVRAGSARSHTDALRATLSAHFRALDQWFVNPVDTTYHLARQLSISPQGIADVYRGLDLPDADFNRQYLYPPASELTESAEQIGQILLNEGIISSPPSLDGLFEANYLPSGGSAR
jgi:NitT/TauT family transport system substrate-binding protein